MGDRIAVCCGTPLVSTVMFSGAEFFCVKCASTIPLFNAERVDSTPELVKEKESNVAWFRETASDYIPPGCWKSSCGKCNRGGEHHIDHATDEEKKRSEVARQNLMSGKPQ